jgi:predicted dienelactone hydrolase
MRRSLLLAAVLMGLANTPAIADAPAPFHVSETRREFIPAVPRNWRGAKTQALVTTIWYPVDASVPEQQHDIGPPGTPYFAGHPLSPGAPIAPAQARYPLILLSHGTGGTADSMDWIGAALAASGYIVAAVNHPGNNALEPMTWEGFTLWWERATDLSEVLDGVLADPVLGPHVDRTRIGALGFSLGGYTVLELAGARTDLPAFLAFCHDHPTDAVCHPPEMARVVDLPTPGAQPSPETAASQARAGASYRDPRIKAVFAIAPALGQAFDAKSFADVSIPIELMVGTKDANVPVPTNASHIATLLPATKLILVPGAAHYTFLPVCEPAFEKIMPALCQDPPGTDRAAVHAIAISQAREFFGRTL